MTPHSELAVLAGTVYQPAWSATVAGDVHYALLPRGDELIVVLPGTHPGEALDWLRDARFLPAYIRGIGLVHSGFGDGARGVGQHGARPRRASFRGHVLRS